MKTIVAAIILFSALPAQAQPNRNCAPRESVVERLANDYGETRQSVGLADGGMVEIFASATGSWSILVTTPDMMTCLVASGQSWEQVASVIEPQGDEG